MSDKPTPETKLLRAIDNQHEVLDAVVNINADLGDLLQDTKNAEGLYLAYETTGVVEAVTFGGSHVALWSSEDEGLPHSEDGNERLPFEPYLRALLLAYLNTVAGLAVSFAAVPLTGTESV